MCVLLPIGIEQKRQKEKKAELAPGQKQPSDRQICSDLQRSSAFQCRSRQAVCNDFTCTHKHKRDEESQNRLRVRIRRQADLKAVSERVRKCKGNLASISPTT